MPCLYRGPNDGSVPIGGGTWATHGLTMLGRHSLGFGVPVWSIEVFRQTSPSETVSVFVDTPIHSCTKQNTNNRNKNNLNYLKMSSIVQQKQPVQRNLR